MPDRESAPGAESIVARTGLSRGGVPLSLNRSPAPDLAPWVARMVAVVVETPETHLMSGGMFSDTPFIRSLIGGDWTTKTADGERKFRNGTVLTGANSRLMPISCEGPILTAGISLRPGALHALAGISDQAVMDRISLSDTIGFGQEKFAALFSGGRDPQIWLRILEEILRDHIRKVRAQPPSQITTAFDMAVFADPNMSVSEYADEQGVGLKRLERIIKRDFGLTPKQVLRRARTLDFASQLVGVGDEAEADELLLRYFDQSHLIKEFLHFFGKTPKQFRSNPIALLPINLETRQARRLEELERLDPAGPRPWRTD